MRFMITVSYEKFINGRGAFKITPTPDKGVGVIRTYL
jgi:hypothetical protein